MYEDLRIKVFARCKYLFYLMAGINSDVQNVISNVRIS